MHNNLAFFLNDTELWHKLNAFDVKSGIYILFLERENNPVTINRFLGNDDNGVLYVGKCDNFLDRVINLKKSILQNGSSHICGRRLKKIKQHNKILNLNELKVKIIQDINPKEKETKFLEEYFQKFGEIPPLNAI